jgi:putative transposase
MRYPFIDVEKALYPVVVLCRTMRVSRSGFYTWKDRPPSLRAREDTRLRTSIRVIHAQSRQTYGSSRILKALRNAGERIGLHRVERLRRAEQLRTCYKRRYRITTQSDHAYPVAENVLAREFTPEAPNRVWAGDITYVATAEGWLYLAVVLDLYSRRVIGWSMGPRLHSTLVQEALSMAVKQRRHADTVLHHSDRGVQYASADFQALLSGQRMICSMSRKGNCWDNAVVESFFKTLKVECLYRQRIQTREQARQMIFEYIEVFYNRQRLHSTLDYQSPAAYEEKYLAA